MTTTPKPGTDKAAKAADEAAKADEKGAPEHEGDAKPSEDAPKVDLGWQAIYELATFGRLGPETTEAMHEALGLPDFGAEGAKASGPPEGDET